ncbi:MAG: sigma-70 family RNA polymerase sigma factor [Opitutales bacterium]
MADSSSAAGIATGALPETAPAHSADWALVQRVQNGDTAAFDLLVRNYRERLFGVVYNLTSNREDAADLTQEAFIKAFRSIGRFQGNASFFTWLYRIAVNTTLSYLKKNRKKRFFSFEKLDDEATQAEIVEHFTSKTSADRSAVAAELQEKLNEAIQKLSLKHRTVVVLFEIEGLSHTDIAEIIGCSEGTVRSRLHYAKLQLQSYLQDYLR